MTPYRFVAVWQCLTCLVSYLSRILRIADGTEAHRFRLGYIGEKTFTPRPSTEVIEMVLYRRTHGTPYCTVICVFDIGDGATRQFDIPRLNGNLQVRHEEGPEERGPGIARQNTRR